MRAHILFSGSKGNCTYISDSNTAILVDAGGCLKRIREAIEQIGDSLDNIQGIFITHEHVDHIKAIYNIAKKYGIKIYTTVETAYAICVPSKSHDVECCKLLASKIMTVKPSKSYEVGTFLVKTFPTSHDAAGSIGFVFQSTAEDKAIGYATDLGVVTEEIKDQLCGVKNVIIESNHDVQMLKNGQYPEFLKDRILSEKGHLSNDACAQTIRYLAENGTKSFTLAHLSEENNTPQLATASAIEALQGFDGCSVKTASAYTITEVEIV